MALDLQPVTTKKPLDLQPVDNRNILQKAGGFVSDVVKGVTQPIVQSALQPGMAIKTAKNAAVAETSKKMVETQMKGTDALLKALKTADTPEEKSTIAKLLQDRVSKFISGETAPKVEDTTVNLPYYGEMKAPTTVKQVLGTGIETVAAGVGVGATAPAKTLAKTLATKLIGPGAKIGAAYGAGESLKRDEGLLDIAKSTAGGALTGAALDLATLGAGRVLSKTGEKIQKIATPQKISKEKVLETAGMIGQGKEAAKKQTVKAIEAIDIKGIKTQKDLNTRINETIKKVSGQVDKQLEKNPEIKKLKDLTIKETSIGGKTVTSTPVKNALDHLQELYKKIGDKVNEQNIKEYIVKAKTKGLSAKEVNNISRQYGADFKSKAFNKMGEPLTSVNARAEENVRRGLKEIARSGMGGKAAEALDKRLSALINTGKLTTKNIEAVNKLKQKIVERGLGEKVGRLAFDTLNTVLGGGLKGFVERGMARGTGLKTLNALELEKALQKNLQLIKKAQKQRLGQETSGAFNKTVSTLAQKLGITVAKTGKILEGLSGAAERVPTMNVGTISERLGKMMPIGATIRDVSKEGYKETGKITTKLLKKLEGKTTVSKQFISDLTNSGDLKQTEKDLIRKALAGEGDKVNVANFANKVKAEILPLKIKKTNVSEKELMGGIPNSRESREMAENGIYAPRYESVVLPENLRGAVANYDEHIFESPIKTTAGDTHFGGYTDKYFGHTRVEDMTPASKGKCDKLR